MLFWSCVEFTDGCLDSPNGDLEVKLEVKLEVEPFSKHLGDNLTSLGIGDSLGKATGLPFAASMSVAPVYYSLLLDLWADV